MSARTKLETFEEVYNRKLTAAEAYANRPRKWMLYTLIVLIIAVMVSWSSSSIQFNGMTTTGSEVAKGVLHGVFNPDTDAAVRHRRYRMCPICCCKLWPLRCWAPCSARFWRFPLLFWPRPTSCRSPFPTCSALLILLIRTIPSLVWALMWIRVTGPGAACGVITQSICSIGMISKMYITAIEDLDTHILESLDAMGCNAFEKIRYGVIPQLTASFISTTIYRFDINLKDATTLGIVGAGGIGASLVQCLNSRRWAMVGSFVWGLMVLALIIEFFSTRIRRKLAHGQ